MRGCLAQRTEASCNIVPDEPEQARGLHEGLKLPASPPGAQPYAAEANRHRLLGYSPVDSRRERLARACHLRGTLGLRQNRGDEHGVLADE
jgi:hypothetical protein